MARQAQEYVKNNVQLTNWYSNINKINESFTSELLKGRPILLIRRKLDEVNEHNLIFAEKLRESHPIFYNAILEHLPGWQTIRKFTAGIHAPSYEFVDAMARFCTAAFSFDEAITRNDLLNGELPSIPPLRTENERWNRYVGIYRCFYIYPDTSEAEEPQLRGGLLQLSEEAGVMHCRIVTGLMDESNFQSVKDLMIDHQGSDFNEEFRAYKKQLPSYDVLVCYEGTMDPSVEDYLLMRLQRTNHSNTAFIFLRRRDGSAQNYYSGGLASVTLCRENKILCYTMAISRHELNIESEDDLLRRYLGLTDKGELGIKITEELDGQWHQTTNSWSRRKAKNNE